MPLSLAKLLCIPVVCAASVAKADVITIFDFDLNMVGGRNVAFSTLPDLSGTPTDPGTFPNSDFDVWGVVDRDVNEDFADDSLIDPSDMFGIMRRLQEDRFFGIEDLENPDNPSGTASATWTFDISGFTDVTVSIDVAAMGNFETINCNTPPCLPDQYNISASIDAGVAIPLFTSSVNEAISQTYILELGTPVVLEDPMFMNGVMLTNQPQTIASAVIGAGSVLTLTLNGQGDSGEEVFVLDNIVIRGTPAPTCPCDWDGNATVNSQDFFDFLAGFFAGNADFNGDGATNSQDFFDFLACFFQPPTGC